MPKIIEHVREQLLAEAKRQIEERGYANTTIRSVAGECGLAVGTVYNYFKSKDMLIASFVVEDWNECVANIKSNAKAAPRELLNAIHTSLVAFSEKHNALFTDNDAAKVFAAVFSERHKVLRDQLAEIILPVCGGDDPVFTSLFVAESLLTWTVAGADFDTVGSLLMKVIK